MNKALNNLKVNLDWGKIKSLVEAQAPKVEGDTMSLVYLPDEKQTDPEVLMVELQWGSQDPDQDGLCVEVGIRLESLNNLETIPLESREEVFVKGFVEDIIQGLRSEGFEQNEDGDFEVTIMTHLLQRMKD